MDSFYLLLFLVSPTLTLQLDEPLILTPLLKQGRYQEAQDKSLVPSLVPGQPNSGYSGFFQIDEVAKTNLFFWFHPKENDPNWKDAPIVLYCMGGYGLSTMKSALQENIFPYNTSQEGIVGRFDMSLARFANLLMIDNTNLGFSHTNDRSLVLNSLDQLAEEQYAVLEQFFLLFPDLKRSIFLCTTSAGGQRAISLSNFILKRDRKVVNLRGIIFGDALTDPEGNFSKVRDYYYYFGLLEKKHAPIIDDFLDKIHAYVKSNDADATWKTMFNDLLFKSIAEPMGSSLPDLENVIEHYTNHDRYLDFITTPEVRNKFHVGNSNFTLDLSFTVPLIRYDYYRKRDFGFILNHKIPYFKFHGQYDGTFAYQSTIKSLRDINWYGQKCFETKTFRRQQIWISGKLFGYLRQCLHVWEVLALNAGHLVPMALPGPIWEVVDTFMKVY